MLQIEVGVGDGGEAKRAVGFSVFKNRAGCSRFCTFLALALL